MTDRERLRAYVGYVLAVVPHGWGIDPAVRAAVARLAVPERMALGVLLDAGGLVREGEVWARARRLDRSGWGQLDVRPVLVRLRVALEPTGVRVERRGGSWAVVLPDEDGASWRAGA